jgi:hypothetical protein
MNSYKGGFLIFSPGTNKQKKELFVMAICTPTVKTFPGNYTIIPSLKKWFSMLSSGLHL